jgi:CubicO group peptidase (beta-lactamase class C family)
MTGWRWSTSALWPGLLLALAGCGGGSGGDGPPDPADPFADVDALAAGAFTRAGIPGMALVIYDDQDRQVFARVYGDFALDRRVAVASASKLVSALAILRLVSQGYLGLDSTTGEVLGWTGPQGAITLRQLLSFTSGLPTSTFPPAVPCMTQATVTLAACVDEISAIEPVALPATTFEYGGTHLHVAGRMAEVVTGSLWNQIFATQLGSVLGLPSAVNYYTFPRQAIGQSNPLIGGGLRASMDEYARLLALAYHRGARNGVQLIDAALMDLQAVEPFPDVTVAASPMADLGLDFRYGFGVWLECATPATGCATVSSPGAFGWTPWLDRERGYYAILGMELAGGPEEGVVDFSVSLAQDLKPAIEAALGR